MTYPHEHEAHVTEELVGMFDTAEPWVPDPESREEADEDVKDFAYFWTHREEQMLESPTGDVVKSDRGERKP